MSARTRRLGVFLFVLVAVPTVWWAVASTEKAAGPNAASPLVPSRSASAASPGLVFSRGACLSFPPAHGTPKGVVFLDAGHGGIDPGARGKTSSGQRVIEKSVTLAIAKVATESLRAAGYQVVVSRYSDIVIRVPTTGDTKYGLFTPLGVRRDVLARIACANAARAQALVSIHMNAFSDPRAGGALTLFDPDRTFAAANRRLATLLHARVMESFRRAGLAVSDRSIVPDTANHGSALTAAGARYGHEIIIGPRARGFVPTPSMMPGAILEPLFLTRPAEADIAASQEGQELLGKAVASAVLQFLANR